MECHLLITCTCATLTQQLKWDWHRWCKQVTSTVLQQNVTTESTSCGCVHHVAAREILQWYLQRYVKYTWPNGIRPFFHSITITRIIKCSHIKVQYYALLSSVLSCMTNFTWICQYMSFAKGLSGTESTYKYQTYCLISMLSLQLVIKECTLHLPTFIYSWRMTYDFHQVHNPRLLTRLRSNKNNMKQSNNMHIYIFNKITLSYRTYQTAVFTSLVYRPSCHLHAQTETCKL